MKFAHSVNKVVNIKYLKHFIHPIYKALYIGL